jgi:DNA replication protein DnaC
MREQILLYAKQLKLPMFAKYTDILRRATPDTQFDELLLELMKSESEQRDENKNRRRLKTANFPFTKTLDELELNRFGSNISGLFVSELASCKFVSEKKNIVMVGNPGRGKTHMAIGIGLKACALGMDVLFKNTATLGAELSEAKNNYALRKLETRIKRADLLILDEMSYVSFDRFQSELLFKVVSDRSERGSIIVTTNLPFSQWTELFENTAMVAALVDRLTFKSYVLDMNGDSYRLAETLKIQTG